jgi:CelD/BcsL family acetyltransferase involved in cellulose biosynthesis
MNIRLPREAVPVAACHGQAERVEGRVIAEFDALAPMRDEWNRLAERSYTNTVFQTYEVHASWWAAFGSTGQLRVLLAENQGGLIGIAPFMLTTRHVFGRARRVMQFIGTRSFDYADFIIDRTRTEVLTLLFGMLDTLEPRFDLLYLRDIPGDSVTLPELRRFFAQRGKPSDVRVLYEAPSRIFGDPAEDRQLPNKKSLKRHYNYFQRSGDLQCRHCVTGEEVMQHLESFFEQHVRRRAATDTRSVFVDERARVFFRELTRALAPKGWLLFSVVSFNRDPIAMHFGFEYGGRITWYKPAFDIAYAKHSPGEVLIKFLLEYALERKARELDFTIGAEPFKYRFANHVRSNYVVRVFPRWLPYFMTRLVLDAKDLVQRSPLLTRFARAAMRRWRDQVSM